MHWLRDPRIGNEMIESFLEKALFGGRLAWIFEINTSDEDVSRRGRMLVLGFLTFLSAAPVTMILSLVKGDHLLIALSAEFSVIALFLMGIWICRKGYVELSSTLIGVSVISVVSFSVTLSELGWMPSAWLGLSGVIMAGLAGSGKSLLTTYLVALIWVIWTAANIPPEHTDVVWASMAEYGIGLTLFSVMVWLFAWSDQRSFLRELNARKEQEGLVAALEQSKAMAEEAREVAEAANLAKSRFLANMSHELRTPLNAIIGYSEMISEEVTDGDLEAELIVDDLDKIRSAGNHLLHIISDVLDLSRIEAGKMTVDMVSFDLSALAREVCDALRPMIINRHNTIRAEIEDGLMMRSDATKVRAILYNLLSNACKFTEDGELGVELCLLEGGDGEERASYVRLVVEDNGIGMSPEVQSRVFEAFVQADSSTTREYGGTGLGLALTRRLARMLGGSILLESEAGVGTRFTVELPLELDEADDM